MNLVIPEKTDTRVTHVLYMYWSHCKLRYGNNDLQRAA